jgi:hypothetical protein
VVLANPLRWLTILLVFAIRSATWWRNVSFPSNQTPNRRRAVRPPPVGGGMGTSVSVSVMWIGGDSLCFRLVRCIASSFSRTKATLFSAPYWLIALMSSARRRAFSFRVWEALSRHMSSA